jgi:hypothetical protein
LSVGEFIMISAVSLFPRRMSARVRICKFLNLIDANFASFINSRSLLKVEVLDTERPNRIIAATTANRNTPRSAY